MHEHTSSVVAGWPGSAEQPNSGAPQCGLNRRRQTCEPPAHVLPVAADLHRTAMSVGLSSLDVERLGSGPTGERHASTRAARSACGFTR